MSAALAIASHPDCARHDQGAGHPEQPARLAAVTAALDGPAFAGTLRLLAAPAPPESLLRAHTGAYVETILGLAGRSAQLDPDTRVGAGSVEAALLAAGAAIAGVDCVLQGRARTAFAIGRPPGHHAEADRAMGFCLFNSAAIAAHHARAAHGLRRIAVVDFDVHHGNGTEAIFAPDPDLFYASSHQFPCYPGTGRASYHGPHGTIANAELRPGDGGRAFRAAWAERLLPALAAFAPELLIVSAGFDAHRDDPLAALELDRADFAWITDELVAAAARDCGGRIVSVLEGGYDLAALADCAALHAAHLMGEAR